MRFDILLFLELILSFLIHFSLCPKFGALCMLRLNRWNVFCRKPGKKFCLGWAPCVLYWIEVYFECLVNDFVVMNWTYKAWLVQNEVDVVQNEVDVLNFCSLFLSLLYACTCACEEQTITTNSCLNLYICKENALVESYTFVCLYKQVLGWWFIFVNFDPIVFLAGDIDLHYIIRFIRVWIWTFSILSIQNCPFKAIRHIVQEP